jgi:hypothetical protein
MPLRFVGQLIVIDNRATMLQNSVGRGTDRGMVPRAAGVRTERYQAQEGARLIDVIELPRVP